MTDKEKKKIVTEASNGETVEWEPFEEDEE